MRGVAAVTTDEKETEQTILEMSQIEDVDDVIRILFGVPPEGVEISFSADEEESNYIFFA